MYVCGGVTRHSEEENHEEACVKGKEWTERNRITILTVMGPDTKEACVCVRVCMEVDKRR